MAFINITKKSQINTCLLAAEEGLVTCEISTDGNISLKKSHILKTVNGQGSAWVLK